MRKFAIIMTILALGIGLTIALAQPGGPPPPPPGGPQPGWGPPPGGPGGPPPPGGPMGPGGLEEGMGPENRMQMWGKFRHEHPDEAQLIINMMEKYPELRMILGIGGGPGGPGSPRGHMGGRMDRMEHRDPEQAERVKKMLTLREQARVLGNKYNHTKNAQEKKKIDGELRSLLAQIYDLRLAEMKFRVQNVENRMAEVKEDLNRFEKDRNGVIDSWFKQLTGKEDYKTF